MIYTFSADELDSFINEIAKSGKCECSQCSGQDGFNISVALIPSINSVGYVWIYRKLTSLTSNENFIYQSLSIITPIMYNTVYLLFVRIDIVSFIEHYRKYGNSSNVIFRLAAIEIMLNFFKYLLVSFES